MKVSESTTPSPTLFWGSSFAWVNPPPGHHRLPLKSESRRPPSPSTFPASFRPLQYLLALSGNQNRGSRYECNTQYMYKHMFHIYSILILYVYFISLSHIMSYHIILQFISLFISLYFMLSYFIVISYFIVLLYCIFFSSII